MVHRLLESEETLDSTMVGYCKKLNPANVSTKAGCKIHSDLEELCKSCIYNFLQQHLYDIELPSTFWCTAMKLDQYIVFAKIEEVSPPSYIVNVIIDPAMTMKVYSKGKYVDWMQCEPMSMSDVSEILGVLDKINVFE